MNPKITIMPTYQNCPIGGWNIDIDNVKINLCNNNVSINYTNSANYIKCKK